MKKVLGILFVLVFMISVCNAGDVKVFRKEVYDVQLESKLVKAGCCFTEIIDLDTINAKMPDQILSTAKTGDWIYNLPNSIGVEDTEKHLDTIEESWDVSFAEVKHGGRIIFTRIIKNNDSVDRESYAWGLTIRCRFIKYR